MPMPIAALSVLCAQLTRDLFTNHRTAPVYLTVMSDPVSASSSRSHLWFAARGDLAVPRSRTTSYGQTNFSVSGPSLWNSLPLSVCDPWQCRSYAHIWRLFCFAEHIVLSIAPAWMRL